MENEIVWMLYIRDGVTYIGNNELERREFDVSRIFNLDNSPKMRYFKMISEDKVLILFSSIASEVIIFDKDNGNCKKMELYSGDSNGTSFSAQYEIQVVNDDIIIYSPGKFCINIVDKKKFKNKSMDIEVSEKEYCKAIKGAKYGNEVYLECRGYSLSGFISPIEVDSKKEVLDE